MAESATKRMGKFTVAEVTESSESPLGGTEAAPTEGQQKLQSESPQNSVEEFTLKTTQTRRRGRPPGQKAKPTVVEQASQAPADYRLWAQLVIASSNTVVVTWLGAECAMERREAEMLEPPVARILSRLPSEQAAKVGVFIDPMVILIALGTWGNRIIRIQRAKRGNGITDAEFARASGLAPVETNSQVQNQPEYRQPVEPDLPARTRPDINPNGIPVAITDQMGEV